MKYICIYCFNISQDMLYIKYNIVLCYRSNYERFKSGMPETDNAVMIANSTKMMMK